MNRYATEGVLRDALAGKRILVACRDGIHVRNALSDMMRTIEGVGIDDAKVKTYGASAKIELPNDRVIYFHRAVSHGIRGLAVDVLVLADGARDMLKTTADVEALHAVLAPDGEMIDA